MLCVQNLSSLSKRKVGRFWFFSGWELTKATETRASSHSVALYFSTNSLLLGFSMPSQVCPPWLGCCVRLRGLVCVSGLSPICAGLVFVLSPVLSPIWSPFWADMLCPPPWSCLSLVSGLVSHLVSQSGLVCCVRLPVLSFSRLRSCLPACLHHPTMLCPPPWSCLCLVSALVSLWSPIWAGMLCPPPWSCLSLVSSLVSQLVWDAVSASLSCLSLAPGLASQLVSRLG